MDKKNKTIAEVFYTAMANKNIASVEQYVHPDVHFSGPLGEMQGKQAYLAGVKNFTNLFTDLKIRTILSSEDQAMVVYDLDFPAPIGQLPSAALMTFTDGLITKIELFFDASPFERK
jgi:ketosteroid isomerase-like protein